MNWKTSSCEARGFCFGAYRVLCPFIHYLPVYCYIQSNCCLLFTCLQPHARGGAQRGSNGREDGDGDVQNLLPDRFCFHGFRV